eukprot:m.44569 g.44569  ORF g.44569 m.44569 type:complete len:428 (-) comp14567_c0_seq1:79-1362(-)
MVKRALLVGCNYPGTDAQLRGCINDVMSIHSMLTRYKGFDASNIKIMIDTDNRYERPTGRNIKRALTELITSGQPGDILVFHFSGHGTQIPAEGPDPEEDGKDEAICPTDLNIIVDDDLRAIVEKLPSGVELTVITDCCHSGGMLDHDKLEIQIGGATQVQGGGNMMDLMTSILGGRELQQKPREIPLDLLAQMLSQRTGQRVAPGNIRMSMANIFGADASQVCLQFMSALTAAGGLSALGGAGGAGGTRNNQAGLMALIGCCMKMMQSQGQAQQQQQGGYAATGYGGQPASGGGYAQPGATYQQPSAQGGGPAPAPFAFPSGFSQPPKPNASLPQEKGILITGCEAHQTSADACPSGDPSKAFGALTNAITTIVSRNPDISYFQLVSEVRRFLSTGGFSQQPCLECSRKNAEKPFICSSGSQTAHV